MFEWDEEKNKLNRKNHGISFEEATEVFNFTHLTYIDDRHDYGEVREITIGQITSLSLIVVVHTQRNGLIRIISARKALKYERSKFYEYIKKTIKGD